MNSPECHIDSKLLDEDIRICVYITDRDTGRIETKELFTLDLNGKYVFTQDIYVCDPRVVLPSIYEAIKKLQNYMDSFNIKGKELFNCLKDMREKYEAKLITLEEIRNIEIFVYENSKYLKTMNKRCMELIKVLKKAKNILR